MLYVGIDPGKDGAYAVVDSNGKLLRVENSPVVKAEKKRVPGKNVSHKKVLVPALQVDVLRDIRQDSINLFGEVRVFAMLEQVSSRENNSMMVAFDFGLSYGAWQAALSAMDFQFELALPKQWQKIMHKGVTPGIDTGEASRIVALRLYPEFAKTFQFKNSHGRADAALLAEYGRRIHQSITAA